MPKNAIRKRQPQSESNDEDQLQINIPELELPWREKCKKNNLGFFDSLKVLPEGLKDVCYNYLYRLEPRVVNQQGPSYIDKYPPDVSIEQIKSEHGGGKYLIILKSDDREPPEMANHKFRVDGAPKYKVGQTLRETGEKVGPEAAGAIPPRSELAEVVKELVALKEDKGLDAAIDLQQKVMERGLELQTRIMDRQAGSVTGNAITDKLLESAIQRLANPPEPPKAPTLEEQMKVFAEMAKIFKPDRSTAVPVEAADPVEQFDRQFNFIKAATGVEHVSDLFNREGKSDAAPWWAAPLTNLVTQLPTLFQQYRQAQAEGFERAIYLRQLPPAPTAAAAGPPPSRPTFEANPAPATPGAQPTTPIAPSQAQLAELWPRVVQSICHAFDEGVDGDSTVTFLQLTYGAPMVDMFFPTLARVDQVNQIVAGLPELASRAQSTRWAAFQEEFISAVEEVLEERGAEEREEDMPAGPSVATAPNGKASPVVEQAS